MTVLLVDDHQEMRNFLKGFLEDWPLHILEASNGEEALEIIKKESVDFVMSDLQMPRGDGWWLLEEVKKMRKDLPVIILSADITFDPTSILYKGADYFIRKPFKLAEMSQLIDKMINKELA